MRILSIMVVGFSVVSVFVRCSVSSGGAGFLVASFKIAEPLVGSDGSVVVFVKVSGSGVVDMDVIELMILSIMDICLSLLAAEEVDMDTASLETFTNSI